MSNPIRKLQAFTQNICLTLCEVSEQDKEHRCCHKMFCGLVEKDLPEGVRYESTGHPIPFMGPKGCVVKPEHRPFCAAFLCTGIQSRHPKLWKQYERLCAKAGVRPNKGLG